MKIHLFCITHRVFFLNDRLARKPDIFGCFDKKVSDLGKSEDISCCVSAKSYCMLVQHRSFESSFRKDSKSGRRSALAPL